MPSTHTAPIAKYTHRPAKIFQARPMTLPASIIFPLATFYRHTPPIFTLPYTLALSFALLFSISWKSIDRACYQTKGSALIIDAGEKFIDAGLS